MLGATTVTAAQLSGPIAIQVHSAGYNSFTCRMAVAQDTKASGPIFLVHHSNGTAWR